MAYTTRMRLKDDCEAKGIEIEDWSSMVQDLQDLQECMEESKKDILATDRMAQRIMDALCENGQGDFLLLRDDEIRKWWKAVLARRQKERRKQEAARRREELRKSGLSKLTPAERKALGIYESNPGPVEIYDPPLA